MSFARLAGRSVLFALGLLVVQAAWSGLTPSGPSAGGASMLPFVLASNVLVGLVLVRLADRSPARGAALFAVLAAVAGGIPLLYLLETLFFDLGIPSAELRWLHGQAVVVGLASATLAAALARKLTGPSTPLRPVPVAAGRLAASAAAYVLCYFVAGIIAWPFLRAYYEARPMPAVTTVALLQVVRGTCLSLLVWLMARHEANGPWPLAVSAGMALAIVGGIAPLIIPGNPYLPDPIRHVHLVEVGVSNLVFGVIAARLVGRR